MSGKKYALANENRMSMVPAVLSICSSGAFVMVPLLNVLIFLAVSPSLAEVAMQKDCSVFW